METTAARPSIPATVPIAPRGYSWHGHSLRPDSTGLALRPEMSDMEVYLADVLRQIVIEAMDYPPVQPHSSYSHLPAHLIERAQDALKAYGLEVEPCAEVMEEVHR